MANTITHTNSTSVAVGNETTPFPGVTALAIPFNGNNVFRNIMTVNNVDTTIPLGGLVAPFGVCSFKNLDAVIAINLKVAAAGTIIARLLPGESWPWRLGSGITAPVAIADSGTPLMEYGMSNP